MDMCQMTGCYDMAEFFADFVDEIETDLNGVILEVCESCANYWTNHKEETVKVRSFRNA